MGLIEKFEEGTKNWEAKLQEDEWYFANLRKWITDGYEPNEAFNAISDAVELILKQNEEFLCLESFQLLLDLSRLADTTELNPVLDAKWDSLRKHVMKLGGRVSELERWHRKSSV